MTGNGGNSSVEPSLAGSGSIHPVAGETPVIENGRVDGISITCMGCNLTQGSLKAIVRINGVISSISVVLQGPAHSAVSSTYVGPTVNQNDLVSIELVGNNTVCTADSMASECYPSMVIILSAD